MYKEFNGVKYKLEKSGYYRQTTNWNSPKNSVRLHQAVWEFYNGPIPQGYYIHHKDGNRANNDILNLELVTPKQHALRHASKERKELSRKNLQLAIEAARYCDYRKDSDAISKASKLGWERRPYFKHTCQLCGKEFETKTRSCKYCSTKCKNTARLHPEKLTKVELVGKKPVYNIEIEGNHNYITSQGIVTHNCDAMRYFIKTKVNPRRLTLD